MMKLLLDVGNSRIKCATLDAGQMHEVRSVAYDKRVLEAGLMPLLASLPTPQQVWVSCVAGQDVKRRLQHCVNHCWRILPEFLSTEAHWNGLRNGYGQAQQLGVDRWLAMLAAWHRCARPCVIMDAGTAVTFDAIDGSGNHLGGLIVPGLTLMQDTLLQNTDLNGFDQAVAVPAGLALADNTLHGVKWGTYFAVTSLAERLVQQVTAITGALPDCLLTGGAGQTLLPGLDAAWEYEEKLVLLGMALKVGD